MKVRKEGVVDRQYAFLGSVPKRKIGTILLRLRRPFVRPSITRLYLLKHDIWQLKFTQLMMYFSCRYIEKILKK